MQGPRRSAGTVCPPDAALAADQAITTAAMELKDAGLQGTMDQLRARAYLDALLGKDSAPPPPAPDTHQRRDTQTGRTRGHGACQYGDLPARSLQRWETASAEPSQRGQRQYGNTQRRAPPVRGPAKGTERAGASSASPDGGSGHDGGGDKEGGNSRGRPGQRRRRERLRPRTRRTPVRPTARAGTGPPTEAAINLTIPLTTLLGLTSHPGEAAAFGPIDATLARTMAAHTAGNPATTWCITVTDEHGHPTAHGCAKPGRHGKPRHTKAPQRTAPPPRAHQPSETPTAPRPVETTTTEPAPKPRPTRHQNRPTRHRQRRTRYRYRYRYRRRPARRVRHLAAAASPAGSQDLT